MPTLGRDHPFIHQVNLNGFRPMLMKHLSKLVVPNLLLLWMDILSPFSSRMVCSMPPPLEDPSSRTLSMSSPGMELLHTPRITLKSTLSLAILFSASPDAVRLLQQTPSSLTLLLLMVVQPWPYSSVVMILLSVMYMASNQPYNSSTPSLITSDNGEPWILTPVMEANMKSPRESLISSIPYSSKIISLNLITKTKIRMKFALDQPSVTPTLSCTPLVAFLAVGYFFCSTSVLYSTTWHLQLFKAYALFKLCKELLQTLVSCFIPHSMSLSTTGLILLSLISTFLHHLMERMVIGSFLPTTQVTGSPGGSSLRILKRSSFVLAFKMPSELRQTSVLHHLQGRGPHFLFPSLIINNLQILCHLIPLMKPHPILSNLSKVSLVKMKIIQSPWPTLTFPIFLADPSFYHLKIMGSATWPKSLTMMTMDNLLKTLNSS